MKTTKIKAGDIVIYSRSSGKIGAIIIRKIENDRFYYFRFFISDTLTSGDRIGAGSFSRQQLQSFEELNSSELGQYYKKQIVDSLFFWTSSMKSFL